MTWIINNNIGTEELRLLKNMVTLSRIQLPQLLKSTLQNHTFPSYYFLLEGWALFAYYTSRHYFIKWDKRKVIDFKKSYSYSSVLTYFACRKTRLRCRKLALNNKYTSKYNYLEVFSVANIRLVMLIRDSCVIQTRFS